MRCPDCASLRGSALYQVHPGRLGLAVVAGLVTGLIGAIILTVVSFFVFFIGPAYGTAVAEVVLRASGRKRGRIIETIGIGSIVFGALVVFAPRLLLLLGVGIPHAGAGALPGPAGYFWGYSLFGILWPLIGFGLAISACFYRLRYL